MIIMFIFLIHKNGVFFRNDPLFFPEALSDNLSESEHPNPY